VTHLFQENKKPTVALATVGFGNFKFSSVFNFRYPRLPPLVEAICQRAVRPSMEPLTQHTLFLIESFIS
jgi:hypothetical protein